MRLSWRFVRPTSPSPRPRRPHVAYTCLALLTLPALLLTITACSRSASSPTSISSSSPASSAPSSVSSPPSPSPSLSPGAQQPTPAGAIAFVRYYFAIYDYSFWTANPQPLQALSDPGCQFCASAITAIETVKKQNDHVVGGRITVDAAVVAPQYSTDRTMVATRLEQAAARTLTPEGKIDSQSEADGGQLLYVALRWTSSHWIFLAGGVSSSADAK